eukprot:gnl/MRDRNA2_/MRDRNA2_35901_c0_seq1.p1 gnl/MRDRNA2_/MRDRNA2_35901_c0~~gnl/MRDRNA2_/MRDRNA2_35901_c0_seq1.p1  ORF type:complete len:271 (+),score=58.35 gnl/MRDRNA2_/MRDRNA2_35901_c0_seq1:99-911(+)
MLIRVRHPGGTVTLDNVPDGGTLADLRELIAQQTGLATNRQRIKGGFPPKVIEDPTGAISLKDAGIGNRDQVVVEECEPPPQDTVSNAGAAVSLPEPLAPEAVGDIERHVIEADNSCLFNSIAYSLSRETPPSVLRDAVASAISSDPGKWDEFTLAESGKPSLEYVDWIRKKDSWGGFIELMVLADHFKVQLCAICIRSLRVEYFPYDPDSKGLRHRAFVLFDGIHYDAVIGRAAAGGGEVLLFGVKDELSLNKAVALAVDLKEISLLPK